MTIAIFVFETSRNIRPSTVDVRPYSLFNLNYGNGSICSRIYAPSSELAAVKSLCERVQRDLGANYAVVDLGSRRPGPEARLSSAELVELIRVRPPLYVAEGARDALAAGFGWVISPDGAAEVSTSGRGFVSRVDTSPVPTPEPVQNCPGASLERLAAAYARHDLGPVPAPVATDYWPIEPSGPVELEDGTPCALPPLDDYSRSRGWISVRVLEVPTGAYPGTYPGDHWSHNIATGAWEGDARYLKVRNVLAAVDYDAPTFDVRAGVNGTDRDSWGTVSSFPDGKAAALWVKANRDGYLAGGKSLAIVKVEPSARNADWREREAARMADGTYAPLPESWGDLVARALPDFFAHLGQSDKRKVAFTESAAAGERDRQKVLSAAEFAERHLRAFLTDGERSRFVSSMLGDSFRALRAPLGDADALEAVYCECDSNGRDVSSCMSHDASDYCSPFHPVRVYAMGGEITLAFLRGGSEASSSYAVDPDAAWDGSGPILARCLIWVRDGEPRQYGRVYGGGTAARTLRTVLEAEGFSSGDLRGARFGRVEHCSQLVVPYLDIGSGSFSDEGDCLIVGGDLCGGSTGGLADAGPRAECQNCGDAYDPDDEGGTVRVASGWGGEQEWCDSCLEGTFCCEVSDERVPDDAAAQYINANGWGATCATWELENVATECADGVWRESVSTCVDCEAVSADDDCAIWDGRDTGNGDHGEGDALCHSCHDEREAAADAVEEASPELPLADAA